MHGKTCASLCLVHLLDCTCITSYLNPSSIYMSVVMEALLDLLFNHSAKRNAGIRVYVYGTWESV